MREREAILEPDRVIIDPHHHLWDGTTLLAESGTYLFAEFKEDVASGHDIRATVYVECSSMYRAGGPDSLKPVGEVEFANGMAAMSASGRYGRPRICAGIVGFADLTLGDRVAPVLEALVAAGGGRLRGIRNMTASDPDGSLSFVRRRPGILGEPQFRAGFAFLAGFGLSFDSWQFHPQLPDVVALAQAFPETTIVVDHLGGPVGIGAYAADRAGAYRAWKGGIQALAACPNVVIKLGGLGMRYVGLPSYGTRAASAVLAEEWRPFIEPCIEAFGAARCMFESNFPVDRPTCSYAALWNAFKRLAADASEAEKTALFSGTAARVYRLEIPTSSRTAAPR